MATAKSSKPAKKAGRKPKAKSVSDGCEPLSPTELKRMRKELGMHQKELAACFGVNLNTVSRWETGKQSPDAPGAIRLALDQLMLEKMMKSEKFMTDIEGQIKVFNRLRQQFADHERRKRATHR